MRSNRIQGIFYCKIALTQPDKASAHLKRVPRSNRGRRIFLCKKSSESQKSCIFIFESHFILVLFVRQVLRLVKLFLYVFILDKLKNATGDAVTTSFQTIKK